MSGWRLLSGITGVIWLFAGMTPGYPRLSMRYTQAEPRHELRAQAVSSASGVGRDRGNDQQRRACMCGPVRSGPADLTFVESGADNAAAGNAHRGYQG